MTYRPTIGGTTNPAVKAGTRAKNNGRYNGNGREWATPPEVFEPLHAEFRFTLDACATPKNSKCPRFFTEAQNGLEQNWGGERVFLNPPYGREVYAWTRKAREEAARGALVVGLLPASCDLAWWHEDVVGHAEVRYLRGRVRFLTDGPYRASGFFASVVVVWRPVQLTVGMPVVVDNPKSETHGWVGRVAVILTNGGEGVYCEFDGKSAGSGVFHFLRRELRPAPPRVAGAEREETKDGGGA